MSVNRGRPWFSSALAVAGSVALLAACGASERDIKAAVDSISKDTSANATAGAAAAGATAGDSARRAAGDTNVAGAAAAGAARAVDSARRDSGAAKKAPPPTKTR